MGDKDNNKGGNKHENKHVHENKHENKNNLREWMMNVLNYQANSAKTPIEKVIVSFDKLKFDKNEMKEAITQLETEYTSKHNIPRLESEGRYQLFLNTQKDLINDWKVTKSKETLSRIVSLQREKYINDPIYTMYYYQYK